MTGVKLMLSCPSMSGNVTCAHSTSVALTALACGQAGVEFMTTDIIGSGIIEAARSIQVAKFMASDCTHMLMVDDDISWQPRTVLNLLATGKDFVGAAYPQRGDSGLWCVRTIDQMGEADFYPRLGLLRVEAVGTGFMMITRAVCERMFAAYPDLKIDDLAMRREERRFLYELFRDLYAFEDDLEFGGRRREGEDFSFCLRWRAIGGEVFVDPFAEMAHGNRTAVLKGRLWDVIKDDVEAAIGAAA